MDEVETIFFAEELYQISTKLASFSDHFDSKELNEVSAQLASLVVHLDGESPVGKPLHTKNTEIEKLIKTANEARYAWIWFSCKVAEVLSAGGSDYMDKTAANFVSFSKNTLDSAPLNTGLPWGAYAGNPILLSRLALVMTDERVRHVMQISKTVANVRGIDDVSTAYNSFLEAANRYIKTYENHRRRLECDLR